MIAYLINEVFDRIGHTWRIGKDDLVPDEEDVQQVLDSAAMKLYDGSVGDRLEVGGLIVERRESGHDVYIYIGSYK